MSKRRALHLLGYTGISLVGVTGLYVFMIRPWHQAWGATTAEATGKMAGDELVPAPNWNVTRAVSIDAPPTAVWPWLVQMGYRRGGLYSYDWLEERLGVLDRPSAQSVLPEFQRLSAGDVIPIGNDPGWPVAALDQEHLLVLDIRRARLHITWSFLLTPTSSGGTRLVLRYRGLARPRIAELPLYAFLDVAEFIMTRKMLLGIKTRAERLAQH
ncbi:MAG TPA: hypothetical protein VLV78_09620 [Thermoanaerobaculia bacterium]|nr:hypothetical protein [Thermoanaerobaculia bacterium]